MTLVATPEVFLHPGEWHFGAAPGRIGTLLGSCVSVTLWHPHHHFGGMCHILLPGRLRSHSHSHTHTHSNSAPLDGRFADEAMELLANEIHARHATPASCQVKLFGGGNMFSGTRAGGMDVGRRNIEATRHALARHGLVPMNEHVGGTTRRRLHFDLSTGHVWLALPEHDQPVSK